MSEFKNFSTNLGEFIILKKDILKMKHSICLLSCFYFLYFFDAMHQYWLSESQTQNESDILNTWISRMWFP